MLDLVLAFVREHQGWLGLTALALSAAIEYVFPPFPGDTVTLLGAALAGRGHFSVWAAMIALTLGSAAGAAADFGLGTLVRRGRARRREAKHGKSTAVGRQVDALVERFRRHGEAYILVNRFLPGVRALFFYAAALAEMRFWRVMLFATLSALAWNGLLMALGIALGLNFERLVEIARTYSLVAWILLGVVVVAIGVRWWWKARRAKKESVSETKESASEKDGTS